MNNMYGVLSLILDIVYTFLEAFCLYSYIEIFYEKKYYNRFFCNSKLFRFGVSIVFYVMIVIILNSIVLTSPYTIVVLLLQNIIFICMFWKCDILNAIAVAGGYFLALSISGSLEVSVLGFIGGEKLIRYATDEQGLTRIIYLLICGTNWYVINVLLARWLRKNKINAYEMKYLAYISLLGLAGFVFIMIQMLASFNINISAVLYTFTFIISISIFATYYVIKSRVLQSKMHALDMQNDILVKNYQQINQIYILNAKQHHDMRHHLNVLYHLLEKGAGEEAKQYINSIQKVVPVVSIKSWTGIDVIDVIINEMDKVAETKGILLNINVQMIPIDISVEKKELCILFANLLENSVEAALSEINLDVQYSHCMLFIKIENDYKIKPRMDNGRLVTTKKDKWNHGFGTQAIEQVVNKYYGSIEYKLLDGKFFTYITIFE